MRLSLACAVVLMLACVPLFSQQASITHHSGTVTVTANGPRPLAQAIVVVREEYGWVVDYEEPPWAASDLRDDSPAAWHAAHPGRSGWMVPAGGAFHSTYPESPGMWSSSADELGVLEKIVSDYNASGNPGKFTVREQIDGSYAVIGISSAGKDGGEVSVRPYLDTSVSLTSATRSAETTLELILSAVSAKTGIVGRIGGGPINLLMNTKVSVGGNNVPARDLLTELNQAMGGKMVWDLWYLPDLGKYALMFRQAALAVPAAFGRKRLIPIGPAPQPIGPPLNPGTAP